jgi:MFS family permease
MVQRFGVPASSASFYAGIIISAFALSEALTGVFWGSISDRVGRKPVVLIGIIGTMLSMLMVGFAENVWVAIAGRALGGSLNGNIGVLQTMVGELIKKPEHERKCLVFPRIISHDNTGWQADTSH